jgi:hypothetical protein
MCFYLASFSFFARKLGIDFQQKKMYSEWEIAKVEFLR